MRFGVSVPNMAEPDVLVALAVEAERAGFDGFFLWDHLSHGDVPLPVVDPWVVLGAVAGATSRVRLGTLVTPLARRRPWQVAAEVATLDRLSGGRAVLGVGLGWPADGDFAAFGDEADDRRRADLLDEGLELLVALWSGAPVQHVGPAYRVDATLRVAPVQQPRPPVWVAGMWPHPRPFARGARFDGVVPLLADGVGGIPLCRPADVRAIVDEVRRLRGDAPFDVVLSPHWEHQAAEYEAAGATWLLTSTDAFAGWVDEVRPRIAAGPPR